MKASILAETLLSAVALVFLGCSGPSESQKRFEAGVELQEQGQLEGAVQEYNEAIRLEQTPTSYEATSTDRPGISSRPCKTTMRASGWAPVRPACTAPGAASTLP